LFIDRNLREKCRSILENIHRQENDFKPGFAVVQVGNREDSNVYIRQKVKAAEEIGIEARVVRLDASISERQVAMSIACSCHHHIVCCLVDTVDSTN
jgi:methylenetetrahydrofolate dehydrogenase (NADP+) / methenyltetrahydrofolate cyclohydrolase / formyltetrahydrofolate synthetase